MGSVYESMMGLNHVSYHFNSADNCYINFHGTSWTLDNGTKFPDVKHFFNVTINENDRVFRGSISWTPLSYAGEVLWTYEIYFSYTLDKSVAGSFITYDNRGHVIRNLTMDGLTQYSSK